MIQSGFQLLYFWFILPPAYPYRVFIVKARPTPLFITGNMEPLLRPSHEGRLREEPTTNSNIDTSTELRIEEIKLHSLKESLRLKRPIQTLRALGLNGLATPDRRRLIQFTETIAVFLAIQAKQTHINKLKQKLKLENHSSVAPNVPLVASQQAKTDKKLKFLKKCDSTIFANWDTKCIKHNSLQQWAACRSKRKTRRKNRGRKRKLHKQSIALLKRAEQAVSKNLVINFSDTEIPKYSLAVLSYGPGFIPTPRLDDLQFRIDASNTASKLAWHCELGNTFDGTELPSSLLKKPMTAPCDTRDKTVVKISSMLTGFSENFNPSKLRRNFNRYEDEGWKWLVNATHKGDIMVSLADKGNAIVITSPAQMLQVQLEKLSDPDRYICLNSDDPTPQLSSTLYELWFQGLTRGYVSAMQAKKTVGIKRAKTGFTKSTADWFKPRFTYGYALLKVHKLCLDQIKAKTMPPARFVSDLSKGLSVRSDKFLAFRWLRDLSVEFASDLVRDSTEALKKLEDLSSNDMVNNSMKSFNLDIVSLYDSLSPELVLKAFDHAVEHLRPEWDPDFVLWLKGLISLSFDSSFLCFRGVFYKSNKGIPTGGTLSVDLANLTVKYVLNIIFKLDNFFSQNIILFLRFVDDGAGLLDATEDQFHSWISRLNEISHSRFNIRFTYEVNPVNDWTTFLDINFKYISGALETDINRKVTDACRYLEYSSHHPRHVFAAVVYSQALRYRRVINSDTLLTRRLEELKSFFLFSSYPEDLVDKAIARVWTAPRCLDYKKRDEAPSEEKTIFWPCTYGPGFQEAKSLANEANKVLKSSHKPMFNKVKLQVVPRRAPNLKDLLFKRKKFSLQVPSTSPVVANHVAGIGAVLVA